MPQGCLVIKSGLSLFIFVFRAKAGRLKSDGFPTYHFAHVVDDYFMGTTHVIRSDDWVASIPLHCELFSAFGFSFPQYGHVPPINKIDGGGKRILSKRKDPGANVLFYDKIGYPESSY